MSAALAGRATVIPSEWGHIEFQPGALPSSPDASARTYDASGWRLSWWPGSVAGGATRFACDIERHARPVEPVLRRLTPETEFTRFWVLAELAAKLGDIPILEWLRRYRAGCAPSLPVGARALLVPAWRDHWMVGLAFIDPAMPAPSLGAARADPWGFQDGAVALSPGTGCIESGHSILQEAE